MSASAQYNQLGGMRISAMEEIETMVGYFLLVALVLTSVYVSRIPMDVLLSFKKPIYQVMGLILVIVITIQYGWIHGILAALAFALILSRANRTINEGLEIFAPQYIVETGENVQTDIIPKNHRWFLEKVMGETPLIIRDKEVKTSAIQDMSEFSMGHSPSTR
jgi:hypothetical protein